MLRMLNDSYKSTTILKLLNPPICPLPAIAIQSLIGGGAEKCAPYFFFILRAHSTGLSLKYRR